MAKEIHAKWTGKEIVFRVWTTYTDTYLTDELSVYQIRETVLVLAIEHAIGEHHVIIEGTAGKPDTELVRSRIPEADLGVAVQRALDSHKLHIDEMMQRALNPENLLKKWCHEKLENLK